MSFVINFIIFSIAFVLTLLYLCFNDKDIWVYTKTGDKYKLLYKGKMKIGDTWVYSITYQSMTDSAVYTREAWSFYHKFLPIKKWKEQLKKNFKR